MIEKASKTSGSVSLDEWSTMGAPNVPYSFAVFGEKYSELRNVPTPSPCPSPSSFIIVSMVTVRLTGRMEIIKLAVTVSVRVNTPLAVADLRDAHPPSPKFLHLHAVFGENWPNNRLAPPLWG